MSDPAVPLDILHENDRPGVYPGSWYSATAKLPDPQPPLSGKQAAEICIVGAGYTGLSAALHLAAAGRKVTVLEAHRVGWGASGRNGGQVSGGQRVDQEALEALVGMPLARRLWEIGEEAKRLVRSLIDANSIQCDPVPGIIHADHRQRFVAGSREHVKRMNGEYGYGALRFLDREEMRALVDSPQYFGGTHDGDAFHIHPLNYALGLADAALKAGVTICEESEVTGWNAGPRMTVSTAHGEVTADAVVFACNGYLGRLVPLVAAHVMPINNFIVATEPLGEELAQKLIADNAAVADSRFIINYFRRSAGHRLLFGGGETYSYRFPGDIAAFVRRPMKAVFPQLADVNIDYAWGGTLAITRSRLPHFVRIGENCWSVSGYSGQGIAMATMAGKLLAEAICGDGHRFELFQSLRGRPFPGGVAMRSPLLAIAMRWFALRDRF
jgi:gamma-glutamylputrescine oxidase